MRTKKEMPRTKRIAVLTQNNLKEILKIGRDKWNLKNKVYVGSYLTPNILNHLELYSLSYNVSKARIIRDLLKDYTSTIETKNQLLTIVTSNIQKLWDFSDADIKFKDFLELVKRDLKVKRVTDRQIKIIIKHLIK